MTQTKLETTTSSTALDDAERQRREGSVLYAKTEALLNELVQRREQDAAHAAEVDERMAHARETPIAECRAREVLVQQVIDNIRTKLEAEPERARVKRIWQHLDEKKEALGYVFDELPTRKVVKRVLQRNGL